MRICLIEDDLKLGAALQASLQHAGQDVLWLRRGADARHWLAEECFDAILLDLGLPDESGFALLKHLRGGGSQTPLLIISAREGLEDRIQGLDLGADDYLVKPFVASELMARLRAVVRRVAGPRASGEPEWQVRDIVLNERTRLVTRDGQAVELSKTEFALLHGLLRKPDSVLTRRELEAVVSPPLEGQVLDVHIYNLRRKLGADCIQTVRGVGYVVRQ
ncbi:MAG: response regulator transcription factor [Rubrivivax sp.]|nr:MAG: response regulator transcription factor [Rubrivivax sp.]